MLQGGQGLLMGRARARARTTSSGAAGRAQQSRPRAAAPPRRQRPHAAAAAANASSSSSSSSSSTSLSSLSSQMREARRQLEESGDARVNTLLDGFRGSNLDVQDFADARTTMKLVGGEDGEEDADSLAGLPLTYDPDAIAAYWARRPTAVATRVVQLISSGGTFLGRLLLDVVTGRSRDEAVAVQRAIEGREALTSLGPAAIKLGQALAIRPDILSPAAMTELQKLCDKVPSFDSRIAMATLCRELGVSSPNEVYSTITPEPLAAASLGQVYKAVLRETGETVAVKVQRPGVLETVSVDLYILRNVANFLKKTVGKDDGTGTDFVAVLEEWASRFFEELDYQKEGQNAEVFARQLTVDLPQIVVPRTYARYTSRRVLTSQWIDGEKLAQSSAADVGALVNLGVIAYLKQLLEPGLLFHADPHPGNLIRTPDGRLAILDFGLVTTIDESAKYGMVDAIAHLVHRDYSRITQDFAQLGFIPPGSDLSAIQPALERVFDAALAGGGAKGINFNDLSADLAAITFQFPFRIPPFFALTIRAIGVLEGIALSSNKDFALVDECFPYLARKLLTDESPRMREALRYMCYGDRNVFDVDRLIDLLNAFESYEVAAGSARGDLDMQVRVGGGQQQGQQQQPPEASSPVGLFGLPPNRFDVRQGTTLGSQGRLRDALRFVFSPEGALFRSFLQEELVKSIDALSRDQLALLVTRLGLGAVRVPVFLPGARARSVALAPTLTEEDRQVVDNVQKLLSFLTNGVGGAGGAGGGVEGGGGAPSRPGAPDVQAVLTELLPLLPTVARETLPELGAALLSRISARVVRELYV
jgi:aarF domain-containing kinase